MTSMTSGRTLHVGIAKELLIDTIRQRGAKFALAHWQGTDEQAIQALENDHRSWIGLSDECDSEGPDGSCLGHNQGSSTWTALTICNPYPEMILLGEKPIENRPLNYKFRGRLFIHAGVSKNWMSVDHFRRFPNLPYGALVGVANVVACLPKGGPWRAKWDELRYGHLFDHPHSNGPYCLILEDIKRLPEPVPCRGQQGLWRVPVDVRRRVLEQLRAAA